MVLGTEEESIDVTAHSMFMMRNFYNTWWILQNVTTNATNASKESMRNAY